MRRTFRLVNVNSTRAVSEKYSVRLLSPDGAYPAEPVVAEDFAILAADEFAWSAVHAPDDEDAYPEGGISWLTITPWSSAPHTLERPQILERDYTKEIFALIRAIEPERLLHHGLYKYLMAAELRRFPQFLEESALSAFISREAALELLRRKLSEVEGKRLKRDDVLDQIREAFPTGEPFVEVLESDWDARVLMAHPINEFGEFWSPPVHREECYDALNTLVYLYRYLLLDEVWQPDEYD